MILPSPGVSLPSRRADSCRRSVGSRPPRAFSLRGRPKAGSARSSNRGAMTHRLTRLVAALSFAAALAPSAASAQERLFQPLFADEPLHRLGLKVHEDPTDFELDYAAGM